MSSYGAKIYIGELGNDGSSSEIEREFAKFGRIRHVWVARNPPGFAFVEYEDQRDAEDAIKDMDGSVVCGRQVIVERADGRGKSRSRPPRHRGRAYNPNDRCYECDERGHYAYDCRFRRRKMRRSRSPRYSRRSRSHSSDRRSRPRSYSRSRSRDRQSRSLSRDARK